MQVDHYQFLWAFVQCMCDGLPGKREYSSSVLRTPSKFHGLRIPGGKDYDYGVHGYLSWSALSGADFIYNTGAFMHNEILESFAPAHWAGDRFVDLGSQMRSGLNFGALESAIIIIIIVMQFSIVFGL